MSCPGTRNGTLGWELGSQTSDFEYRPRGLTGSITSNFLENWAQNAAFRGLIGTNGSESMQNRDP